MHDDAPGKPVRRQKSAGAIDVDSLLRLITRLAEAGHRPRRIRVGEVEVELTVAPVVVRQEPAAPEESAPVRVLSPDRPGGPRTYLGSKLAELAADRERRRQFPDGEAD